MKVIKMKEKSLKDRIIDKIILFILLSPFVGAAFWFYVQYEQTFG